MADTLEHLKTPRCIATELDRVQSKILLASRKHEYHASEAAFQAKVMLIEVRKLDALRHRLNKFS